MQQKQNLSIRDKFPTLLSGNLARKPKNLLTEFAMESHQV